MSVEAIDAQKLVQILENESNIIIYGADMLGQGVYLIAESLQLAYKIKGFAVSSHIAHLDEYKSIPIRNVDQWKLREAYVIVAIRERYMEDIISNIRECNFAYAGIVTLKDFFTNQYVGRKAELFCKLKKMELPDEIFVRFCVHSLWRYRLDFEVNIVDHCNLNCQCCNHFSPIAKPYYLALKEYEKDINRIFDLTKGNVGRVWLLGGEPLLHPEVEEFLYLTRAILKNAYISLDTNGSLILNREESFFEALRVNEIELKITKYPVAIPYGEIERKLVDENVRYSYTLESRILKTTYHLPLVEKSEMDETENYIKCEHANNCITLKNGRLYTCPIAAHAHYFNEYFNRHLYVGGENSINIYEVENISEILEFLEKPIPFCKHCNIDKYTYDIEWAVSKKAITEWT